jgi:hypothetical protein
MEDLDDFDPREEINLCSRCQRWGMIFLRSMGRRSTVDWFACTVCGHLATRPRHNERDEADAAVEKSLGRC